jgi:hypothetical protein
MLLALVGSSIGCSSGRDSEAQLREWMTGSFSNAAQAETDPSYRAVRLRATRIWPERSPGFWIYVEQSFSDGGEEPYRQRIHHVTKVATDAFRSRTYLLPDPSRSFDEMTLEDLPADSLVGRPGCDILLLRQGDSFVGSTNGRECGNVLRGASYATSEVRITAGTLYAWDRGFDADGVQVWGPIRGGYELRRVDDRHEWID